jgi:phosphoribosylglycinamide formyltransferase-1
MGSEAVRLGVLASGRGSNFAALADAARAGRLGGEIAVLVVDRADAGAREEARRRSIPDLFLDPGPKRTRLVPESEKRLVAQLQDHGVRVVLLAGFMRMVHEDLLDAFPMSVINIHPSLLPAFPGLEAPRQALEHGVTITGTTVHLVDSSLDGGPILAQAAVPVLPGDDVHSLTLRIQAAEHVLYPETVRRFLESPPRLEGRRVLWETNAGHAGRAR